MMEHRRVQGLFAVVLALASFAASAPALGAAPTAQDFTDWTAVAGSPAVATGTLHGQSVTLSGTHVFAPPVSVVDGHWTFLAGPDFSPPLAGTDVIQVGASTLTESYTLSFGAPVTDTELEIGSLGSRLDFPSGTAINRISGQPGFKVSGRTITGAPTNTLGPDGTNDSNGTVQLIGTFTSISFTATFAGSTEDGVILQVGAAAPVSPPPPGAPVARLAISPNPSCVGVPTRLDASASSAPTPITRYRFEYREDDLSGHPAATSTQARTPVLSTWYRPPAPVTLTITTTTGATASTTETVDFIQTSSVAPDVRCPSTNTGATTSPVSTTGPSTTDPSGRTAGVLTSCVLSRTCTGDMVAATQMQQALDALTAQRRRDALTAEINQDERALAVRRAQVDEYAAKAKAAEDRGDVTDANVLLVLKKIYQRMVKDLEQEIKELIAERDHNARTAKQEFAALLNGSVAPARARRRRPDIVGAAPFRLAPGSRTTVRLPLRAAARRALERYHMLPVTLWIYTVTPTGRHQITSRHIMIRTPVRHRR